MHPRALLAISHLPTFGGTLAALRGADHGSPLGPLDLTSKTSNVYPVADVPTRIPPGAPRARCSPSDAGEMASAGRIGASRTAHAPARQDQARPAVVFISPGASEAPPGLASNRVPVAARLLILTDHPGLDLVTSSSAKAMGPGGSHSGAGLVMEMPRLHNTLRNTRSKRGADDSGSAIGEGTSHVIARSPPGAPLCIASIFCRGG